MSKSRSEPKVSLVVEAPDSTTEIFLIDRGFRRIAAATGVLERRVPPGLYKLRFRSGGTMSDRLIEVPAGEEEVRIEEAPLEFRSPAPLARTRSASEEQREAARRESRDTHARIGGGSRLYLFVRDPEGRGWEAAGVTLHDAEGSECFDLARGAANVAEGWSAASLEVTPGTYRLRVQSQPLGVYEMFLVACPGWQTQAFLCVEELQERKAELRRPALRSASVLMAREDLGFDPDSSDARLADLARLGLKSGRNVLAQEDLRRMLEGKFENPMLGLYAGHLLLLEHRPNRPLLRTVCENLGHLLGAHPDAEALALQVPRFEGRRDVFVEPPMLRRSWDLVVQANRRRPGLVASRSLMDRVADGLVQAGPWLLWRLPSRELSAAPEAPEPEATASDARKWLDAVVDRPSAAQEALSGLLGDVPRSGKLTSLDKGVLRTIETTALQTIERTERPSAARLESEVARQLNVPLVSVRRAIRRPAHGIDPGKLRPSTDPENL